MKTIKKTKEYYVPKFEEITMFETNDGKIFHKEDEANKHEELIIRKREVESKFKTKIVKPYDYGIDYCDNLISCKLLYVEKLDEETKKELEFLYPYLSYDKSKSDDIKIGWNFFIETEYESCSLGKWGNYNLHIYGLNDIIKEKEEELKKLKEI
jgi:hypothetical protein